MAKEKWNYGMIETVFESAELPSYDEFMTLIENKLTEPGNFEPLFSGKIAGKDEFWTFVRHKTEPKEIYEICNGRLPNVKRYSHCYSFIANFFITYIVLRILIKQVFIRNVTCMQFMVSFFQSFQCIN